MPHDFLSCDKRWGGGGGIGEDFCECGGGGRSSDRCGKTLSRAWERHLTQQLRPRSLIRFQFNRSYHVAQPEFADCSVGMLDRRGFCTLGDDFVVDTTVEYSMDKHNRWDLMEAMLHIYPSIGVSVFHVAKEFANFITRQRPPSCQCNLSWVVHARGILRWRRKALGSAANVVAELASSNPNPRRRKRQTRRLRQKLAKAATLEQRTLAKLKDELDDYSANDPTRKLRIGESGGQLFNFYEQLDLPSRVSGDFDPTPVQVLLNQALSAPSQLIMRTVQPPEAKREGNRPVWHQRRMPLGEMEGAVPTAPKHWRRRRRLAARYEAQEGLNDWLEERQDDRYKFRHACYRDDGVVLSSILGGDSAEDIPDRFIDFSLDTSRSSTADTNVSVDMENGDLPEEADDRDSENQDDEFRPVMSVRRDQLLESPGALVSDSWPAKLWLHPALSMARGLGPGPAVLAEELPGAAESRRGMARVRLHLLGCGGGAARRGLLCRLLASADPFGSLPRLLSCLPETATISPEADPEAADQFSSGVRISAMTFPPMYSWLYSAKSRERARIAPPKPPEFRPAANANKNRIKAGQRLPPLLPPTKSLSTPRISNSAAAWRRSLDRRMRESACATCGVASPRPPLCPPADWLTALTGCGHWHCHHCWATHVTRCVAAGGSGAVACPSPGCTLLADPATVLWFTTRDRLYHQCLRQAAWQPLP